MINKDGGGDNFSILWGGHSCYEGGHRAHGGSPHKGKPWGAYSNHYGKAAIV